MDNSEIREIAENAMTLFRNGLTDNRSDSIMKALQDHGVPICDDLWCEIEEAYDEEYYRYC
jgi:hypothetical protein